MKIKKIFLKNLFKIFFSLFFLFIILRKIDFQLTLNFLFSIDIIILIMVFILAVWSILISSFKLKIIYNILCKNKISFKEATKINFIGIFFNFILPGTISGDLYRIIKIRKRGSAPGKSTAIILWDRLTGLFALCFNIFIGVIFSKNELLENFLKNINVLSFDLSKLNYILIVLIPLLFVIYYFLVKKRTIFIEIISHLNSFVKNYQKFLLILFLSLLFQILSPIMFWLTLKAINHSVQLNFFNIIFAIGLINIITILPLSFQGIGIREYLYLVFFPKIDLNILITASLISYFIYFTCAIIGFLMFNFSKNEL